VDCPPAEAEGIREKRHIWPAGRNLMTHALHPQSNSRYFYHLKIIGGIALVIGGLSFATLILLLTSISGSTGTTYWNIVQSGSVTHQSLGTGMALAGLFLTGGAAVITWLISLYASFRIAGPLFRISRNLEILAGSGAATLTPIRKKDQLQAEMQQLAQSARVLQDHYSEMEAAADNALALIDSGGHGLGQSLARLRELERRVRL
jgi:hypothetical protein